MSLLHACTKCAAMTARAERAEAERDTAIASCAAMREALERATEAAMLVQGLYDHTAALRAERDALLERVRLGRRSEGG
jgi:hypothetical protein